MTPLVQSFLKQIRSADTHDHGFENKNQSSRQLSFQSTSFSFESRKILFQKRDFGRYLAQIKGDSSALNAAANQLEAFRRKSLKEAFDKRRRRALTTSEEEALGQLMALCETYLARISQLLQRSFVGTETGCQLFMDEDGQVLLNGLNVQKAIERYQEYPNPKSRLFLKGLWQRLQKVRHNPSFMLRHYHLQDVLSHLDGEMSQLLQA